VPNRSYEKGRRFENHVAKFFRSMFGQFGDASRSFMSRGVDVTFVDYSMRVWAVSCKCMKLPKKIWNELETHDIVAISEDRKEKAYVILESKLKELDPEGNLSQYLPNGTEG
jgi:hypothetical protein